MATRRTEGMSVMPRMPVMLSLMGFLGRLRLVAKLLQLIRAAIVSSVRLLPVILSLLVIKRWMLVI